MNECDQIITRSKQPDIRAASKEMAAMTGESNRFIFVRLLASHGDVDKALEMCAYVCKMYDKGKVVKRADGKPRTKGGTVIKILKSSLSQDTIKALRAADRQAAKQNRNKAKQHKKQR